MKANGNLILFSLAFYFLSGCENRNVEVKIKKPHIEILDGNCIEPQKLQHFILKDFSSPYKITVGNIYSICEQDPTLGKYAYTIYLKQPLLFQDSIIISVVGMKADSKDSNKIFSGLIFSQKLKVCKK